MISARTARRLWCSCERASIWKKGCAHFFVKDLLLRRGTTIIIPPPKAAAASFTSLPNTQLTDAYSATDLALDSVVKIFTVCSSPNYFLPWQNKPQRENMGSGFAIPGKKILTNAHVVADHTFVLVRKHGSPTKYRAEIQAIGHECDLAILVVESEEFWHGMNFLELGDIPFLQQAVAVVGYPQGPIPYNIISASSTPDFMLYLFQISSCFD